MHQAVISWLLWFDSSLVVYRFGVPLFRFKLSMRYNMWISWHVRRRKAHRCRWVSDMWAGTAYLSDSWFTKLGAFSMRRRISTSKSAPSFSYGYPINRPVFSQQLAYIVLTPSLPPFSMFYQSQKTLNIIPSLQKTQPVYVHYFLPENAINNNRRDETTRWTQIRNIITDKRDENWESSKLRLT